jgi:signal transduction histidine kinase
MAGEHPTAGDAFEPLEIQSILVNNQPRTPGRNGEWNLGASAENISFLFGTRTNAQQTPVRVRYKLEGHDADWRDGGGEMVFAIRFYNAAGDQVVQRNFPATGQSAGWTGSLATSPSRHRRETLVVPEQASRFMVVLTSAGPPSAVGVYAVAGFVVSKAGGNSPSTVLLESPFNRSASEDANPTPAGWTRDGNHSSMASIVTIGDRPGQKALAILDDDGRSHAEWHNTMETAPVVKAGDQLLLEWDEAFSIGVGDANTANYPKLAEGSYRFSVAGFDIYGNPTGPRTSIAVLVPPPLLRTAWFWGAFAAWVVVMLTGAWRYVVWHKMRREMVRLRSERALENERLRIARDLHDDFGARLTEISLASALAKKKPNFPETANADFEHISRLSRELVAALYETVWAVNPENDNLDALGNYLCQMANHLCEQALLPCRFRVLDLPSDVQVSSQTRHNIIMAVKEAIHNAIKHARASELVLGVSFENGIVSISVEDNGCGFEAAGCRAGNGLTNMKRRLTDLNGSCDVRSQPGAGTKVVMELRLQHN